MTRKALNQIPFFVVLSLLVAILSGCTSPSNSTALYSNPAGFYEPPQIPLKELEPGTPSAEIFFVADSIIKRGTVWHLLDAETCRLNSSGAYENAKLPANRPIVIGAHVTYSPAPRRVVVCHINIEFTPLEGRIYQATFEADSVALNPSGQAVDNKLGRCRMAISLRGNTEIPGPTVTTTRSRCPT